MKSEYNSTIYLVFSVANCVHKPLFCMYVWVCMRVSVCIYACVCVYVCVYLRVYLRVYLCVYLCACVRVRACTLSSFNDSPV